MNINVIQPILSCTEPTPTIFAVLKNDLARLIIEDPFHRFLISNIWVEFSNEVMELKSIKKYFFHSYSFIFIK